MVYLFISGMLVVYVVFFELVQLLTAVFRDGAVHSFSSVDISKILKGPKNCCFRQQSKAELTQKEIIVKKPDLRDALRIFFFPL